MSWELFGHYLCQRWYLKIETAQFIKAEMTILCFVFSWCVMGSCLGVVSKSLEMAAALRGIFQ